MGENCFCHFNGYQVKDATARKQIQALDDSKESKDVGYKSKVCYGSEKNATVFSAMANDDGKPDVMEGSTKAIALYTSRDAVGFYNSVKTRPPIYTIADAVYNYEGFSVENVAEYPEMKPGMFVDSGNRGDANVSWYVGKIASISGNNVVLDDGWWLVRTDGAEPTRGTPPSSNVLYVEQTTGFWARNTNVFCENIPNANTAVGDEIGIFNEKDLDSVEAIGGIDVVSLGSQPAHFGVKVRSGRSKFNTAFEAKDCGIALDVKNGSGQRVQSIDGSGNIERMLFTAMTNTHGNVTHPINLISSAAPTTLVLPAPSTRADGELFIFVNLSGDFRIITSDNGIADLKTGSVAMTTGIYINNYETLFVMKNGNGYYVINRYAPET